MSFLRVLKTKIGALDIDGVARLWVIYYDSKHKIREIKSLYAPKSYKGSRPCYTDQELVDLLEKIH
jgi:hypothetical protein